VGFLGKLIGAVRILKSALCVPVTGLIVALFVVFGGGPMGVSGQFMLFRSSAMDFVHGGLFSALWGDRLARRPPVGFREVRLLAVGRFTPQRVAEFLGLWRSLEVSSQYFTIRGVMTVQLAVGIPVRAKRGAFQRNTRKQAA